MKKKYWFVITVVLVGATLFLLVWNYTFRKTALSVDSQKSDIEITATALVQAFETDENSANALYLDKILCVTGNVTSIEESSSGITITLKDDEAISGVICSFDKTAIDLSSVKKGSILQIKGLCSGYLMDVILNRCSVCN